MSDIDRLTLVVAGLGFLLINRIPEGDVSRWSFKRLTISLAGSFVLTALVVYPVITILFHV